MQTTSKFFEDLARVGKGMFSTFGAVRQEIKGQVRQKCDDILIQCDMVRREEFEAVRDMAIKARTEQERLKERVHELEQALTVKKKKRQIKTAVQSDTKKEKK